MEDMQKMFRFRPSQYGKVNAPTLAYKCVYGKAPSFPIRGRYGHPQQQYKDLVVDKNLDTKILDDLNSIPKIEIRSVCAGHDSDSVTHIIFRPYNQDEDYITSIVSKLNKGATKCIQDVGNGGFIRICVATKNWYREETPNTTWKQWWDNIAIKIKNAVK